METSSKLHVTSILRKHYNSVADLHSYLVDILDFTNGDSAETTPIISETDSIKYKTLLNHSYVCTKQVFVKKFRQYPPVLEMREVFDEAQLRIFKYRRPQNIITSGYRQAFHTGDQGKRGMGRIGITNYFINTVITAFQGLEWETLLFRIGEDAMLHLLMDTSIFTPLPNDCLCQLTGEPILFIVPLQNVSTSDSVPSVVKGKRPLEGVEGTIERPKKRRKTENSSSSVKHTKSLGGKCYSPADISFFRVRLFYSRPNYVPHTNQILVGLPLRHVLNRMCPSYPQKPTVETNNTIDLTNPRENAERARHLSKYIFARQYGLNTPFYSTATKNSSFNFGDYMDREIEIKMMGPCATPKRLKEILPLLEKMIRRHSKCGYIPLRDKSCPSKVKNRGAKDLDSSVILEMMSENSIQLRSQISMSAFNNSVDSNGNPILPAGLTQAEKHAKQKPRFAEFACSHIEVYRYVALVTNTVIPKSFWGSRGNLDLVLKHVKQFISCRRYETLTLHYVLQNFSTTACDWLCPPGSGARNQTRVSVSDSSKRRELLEDFLFWYFDSFVLSLIKTAFYVTESSAFRNQVIYFRHDDWATLCAPLVERLTTVTFEKLSDVEASEILRQRKLGFSFVRLLPKETGVRPIVNLRRRKTIIRGAFSSEQSINQILQAAFSILTYERMNQPKLLGASAFGPDDIYFKLKEFKASLPRDVNGSLPKLYFVKLDVQACFDTIDQMKLLQIIRELISEDVYMIQKYGQMRMVGDKVQKTYVKKAMSTDDHPHFLRHAADLAGALRNTIFVDQVVYPLSKKQEVLHLLEEHITENIVKIGRSYYRQMVGIPQGSVLSSILCSFFYGDLERKFAKFTSDSPGVLLRLIDDYLFITTSLPKAKAFLSMMKKGHPEYGCFIAQEKTLTNFDQGDEVFNVIDSSQKTFPWCGYSINMSDLSITVDYTRYHGSGLRSTLTVDRGRKPGAGFTYKLLQMAKAKSHAIFSDRELNTEHVIYLNIYQNFLLTAMKMYEYMREFGPKRKRNTAFLRAAIKRAILYSYSTVRSQARRKNVRIDEEESGLHKEAVVWLGHHAFQHVLSRNSEKYRSLVESFRLELRLGKYRLYARRFKALVKEGQAGLVQIVR